MRFLYARRSLLLSLAALSTLAAAASSQADSPRILPWGDAQPDAATFAAYSSQRGRSYLVWSLVDLEDGSLASEFWSTEGDFQLLRDSDEWVLKLDPEDEELMEGKRASNRGFLRKKPSVVRALVEPESLSGTGYRRSAPQQRLNEDARRTVYIDKGDVWRAEFDWNTGQLVEQKQLTQQGVFAGKQPVLWSGDYVFLWGGFDADKPAVRVHTETGEVSEVDWLNFTALGDGPKGVPHFATNPSETVAFLGVGDWVQLVDLSDGRTLRVPLDTPLDANGVPEAPPVSSTTGSFNAGSALHWLDDSTAFLSIGTGAHFARLDLAQARVSLVRWSSLPGVPAGETVVEPSCRGSRAPTWSSCASRWIEARTATHSWT